jgi:hypothetical protein
MRELYMHELYGYIDDNIIRKLRLAYENQIDMLNLFAFTPPMILLHELVDQLQFSNPR